MTPLPRLRAPALFRIWPAPFPAPLTALLLALALVLAAAGPARAEKIPLSALSSYLNAIDTAETDFTQINSDGTIATGRLFLKRPGRARFEYAPPDRSLVMAGGGMVAIFDPKSNQPPEQYPLARTPLSLILAERIDLGRARMVVGHAEVENTTRVRAQDPDHPEYGQIELVFSANPVELRQWIISDDAGNQTTVILGELQKGASLRASLFDITAEARKRGF
jgi:outer membrane lipoprotein-sorting protein